MTKAQLSAANKQFNEVRYSWHFDAAKGTLEVCNERTGSLRFYKWDAKGSRWISHSK